MEDAALEIRVQEREQPVQDRWLGKFRYGPFPYSVLGGMIVSAVAGAGAGSLISGGDASYMVLGELAGGVIGAVAVTCYRWRRDVLYHQNYPALADLVAREKEFYAHPHFEKLKPLYRDALLLDYLHAALRKQEDLQVIDTVKKHLSPQRAGFVRSALEEYIFSLTSPPLTEGRLTIQNLPHVESVVRRDEFSLRQRRIYLNVIAKEYFELKILKDAERLWKETGNRRKLRNDLLPCYRERQDYEKVRELMAL